MPDDDAPSLTGIIVGPAPIPILRATEDMEAKFGLAGLDENAGLTADDGDSVHVFILDKALSKLLIYVEYCFI